jgi:hypothetical protein
MALFIIGTDWLTKYTLQVKQGDDLKFTLKEPIVIDGVRIEQRKDELRFCVLNYDITDKNRLNLAFNLSRALTLIFAVNLTTYWGKPLGIKGLPKNNLMNKVRVYKDMEKLGSSKSTVPLEQHHVDGILEYAKALDSLTDNITYKISEGFSWYNKGLGETELVNKFILFYITIEFLGNYLNRNRDSSTKVRTILNKYSNDTSLTQSIINLRNEIFHEGVKRADILPYIQVMDSTIREAFRDIVFQKISPK